MAEKVYPSQLQDRFIVRLPEGMREQIAAAAKANNRSMNAEIVARLQQSFDPPRMIVVGDPTPAEVEAYASSMMGKLAGRFEEMLVEMLERRGIVPARRDPEKAGGEGQSKG